MDANVFVGGNTKKLFGIAGGQLEYVSQRVELRRKEPGGGYYSTMIIRFTDHDHWKREGGISDDLIEGVYYELEFPIYEE